MTSQWLSTNRSVRFFDYIWQGSNSRRSSTVSTMQVTYRPDWISKIEEDPSFLIKQSRFTYISIGLSVVEGELMEVYFVFSWADWWQYLLFESKKFKRWEELVFDSLFKLLIKLGRENAEFSRICKSILTTKNHSSSKITFLSGRAYRGTVCDAIGHFCGLP